MPKKILDHVCYALREHDTAAETDLFEQNVPGRHAFPYDPKSKTSPVTALRWAKHEHHYNGKQSKDYEPDIIYRHNDPIDLRILSLEFRGNGGRAYKVIDGSDYIFDLREDQLVEAIRTCGISPGGKINGQFVWGFSGSTLRLILVGGADHKEITEAEADTPSKFITSGFKPNVVYETSDGTHRGYVGKLKLPDRKIGHAFIEGRHSYYYVPSHFMPNITDVDAKRSAWQALSVDERWQEHLKSNDHDVVLLTSPKFTKIITNVDLSKFRDPGSHRFISGIGIDVCEQDYVLQHGERPRNPHYYSYGMTQASWQEFETKTREDQRRWREDFSKRVQWL